MQQTHDATQLAAYYLWEQRGCPIGDPEEDWFHAEQEVSAPKQPGLIVVAAEVVGSVLGSVVGIATSVGSLIHSD